VVSSQPPNRSLALDTANSECNHKIFLHRSTSNWGVVCSFVVQAALRAPLEGASDRLAERAEFRVGVGVGVVALVVEGVRCGGL
jgi:hypothetical protein